MYRTLLAAAAAFGLGTSALAAIPFYPTAGVENPVSYSFTKQGDGNLIAYFVGATAGLTNRLGVIVNGVDRGTGLSNLDPLGTSFDYGFTSAGDSLVFYINTSAGETFFSSASLNADGLQHVYSTFYGGGDTVGITSFASGSYTYVGFEDLPGGGDLDYDDINFVFSDVRVPEPATWAMLISGFGLVGFVARRRRTTATA